MCTHTASFAVADWLSLAAAPAFAAMALLSGIFGSDAMDPLCSAAHGGSLLSGMVPMYLLMSGFHSAPWLRMISRLRRVAGRVDGFNPPLAPSDAHG